MKPAKPATSSTISSHAGIVDPLAHDPEKDCPALGCGMQRFSEKIMRKQ
jgi:hypothetical protein